MAWNVDPAHTVVGFSARHMGLSTVRGRFTNVSGTLETDPQDLTRTTGEVEIDAASIDTGNADRDAHLRSADFLDVEHHPTIKFVPTQVQLQGGDEFTVTGDLTIRGQTRPVTLRYEHGGEGTDPFGKHKIGGSLAGEIKRSDWGLTWNVALEAGGWLVSDKIKIEVDGQLVEAARPASIPRAVDEVMKPSEAEQPARPERR